MDFFNDVTVGSVVFKWCISKCSFSPNCQLSEPIYDADNWPS